MNIDHMLHMTLDASAYPTFTDTLQRPAVTSSITVLYTVSSVGSYMKLEGETEDGEDCCRFWLASDPTMPGALRALFDRHRPGWS